jgi:hypothetical protein
MLQQRFVLNQIIFIKEVVGGLSALPEEDQRGVATFCLRPREESMQIDQWDG